MPALRLDARAGKDTFCIDPYAIVSALFCCRRFVSGMLRLYCFLAKYKYMVYTLKQSTMCQGRFYNDGMIGKLICWSL